MAKFDGDVAVSYDDPDGESPRLNFDNFEQGFVSVFVCFIGEDWQLVMHDYIRATNDLLKSYLFFVSLMVVGNLFLMNLFLAILLKNFEEVKEGVFETTEELKEASPKKSSSGVFSSAVYSVKLNLKRVFLNRDLSSSQSSVGSDGHVPKYPGKGIRGSIEQSSEFNINESLHSSSIKQSSYHRSSQH
mmetsp:Transcript_40272/g.61452  ORF Transcript_40272/g.61452 Transcript_40272/m.61452 type:complete len:188 (-) Transcript_40272:5238-5801(-)